MAVYILHSTLVLHFQNDTVLGVFSTPVASGSESRSEIEHKQLQLRYITILWHSLGVSIHMHTDHSLMS